MTIAPGGLREHTLPILRHTSDGPEPFGECAIRLVFTAPGQDTDPAAWTITHPLGSVAGGTHTEVVFVDEMPDAPLPVAEHVLDSIVRQLAGEVYGPGRWAFHYRPDQVAESVLRHGSLLRERVEVSAVEVWA